MCLRVSKWLLSFPALLFAASLVGCAPQERAPAPNVEPLSEAAREVAYRDHVLYERDRVEWLHPGAVIPDVERVRFVSATEWALAMAECMVGEGFQVTARPDGGIHAELVPPEQGEAQAIAFYVCSVRYPIDPIYLVPLAEDQMYYLYDYYVLELVPCLEAEGHAISEPPSWQVFRDGYLTDPWSPYSDLPPSDEDDWIAINEKCPQQPANLFGPGT